VRLDNKDLLHFAEFLNDSDSYLFELGKLLRQNIGFRQEIKVAVAMPNLHFRYVLVHEVLPRNLEGIWEMIDLN
jgi:hypothetical protein